MSKWENDIILDQALNYIKNNVTQLCICRAQPMIYIEATTTYKLAIQTGLTSASFTGPADGTVNGRKITINTLTNIAVDLSGDAIYIALCSGDTLLFVTTCTLQTLTAGNTITIPAWKIEIADPT
jgi:hypothetical protein